MKVPCRTTVPVTSTVVTSRLKGYTMLDLKEKQVSGTLPRVSVKKMSKFQPVLNFFEGLFLTPVVRATNT